MSKAKFDQTTFSGRIPGEHGDCLRACVYTLLGRNIGLPHPIDGESASWNFEFFDEIERKTGKELIYHPKEKLNWPEYVIRCGQSSRNMRHAVVWNTYENRMFHDPHPTRSGLMTFDGWYVLK